MTTAVAITLAAIAITYLFTGAILVLICLMDKRYRAKEIAYLLFLWPAILFDISSMKGRD